MLCDNCKNNNVCKYRDEVIEKEEYINNIPDTLPLLIGKNCKLKRSYENEVENNAQS